MVLPKRIQEGLDELLLLRDLPVLVEGKNDKIALEKLGFVSVFYLDSPLFSVVEFLERYDEIVLFTDLDKEGDKLFKSLKHDFLQKGVRVNEKGRKALAKTPVRQVEELGKYLKNKEEKEC